MTFDDLCERLKQEDEVTLLEILDLTSNEIVDLLEAEIFDRQDRIRNYYNEDDEVLDREEG